MTFSKRTFPSVRNGLKKFGAAVGALGVLATLNACADPAAPYAPNTYNAGQLNTPQSGAVVTITSVQAVRVRLPNGSNQTTATEASSLGLGALGAGLGTAFGGWAGGLGGGLGGAALGALAGHEIAGGTATVPGTTIGYRIGSGPVQFVTEVGKPCNWQVGLNAQLIGAGSQARVQPNAQCPR
ncbi:hypothetical protein E3E12_04190 [Formicincola oecophyllae]|uniref:Glycine zipper 2TM domain-containing protein n=1 Tax=Formicincola oecophyllae TaxID=2558361 RepID=A0A4Y6UAN3_9PROT|nr:hypothetical protein [Formicincola oecophyllae]QDH13526.1 hypothetical protein E3E12_04190 [Formicincola oecophyllae]